MPCNIAVEKTPRFGHAMDVWEERRNGKWNTEHIKEVSALSPFHRWKNWGREEKWFTHIPLSLVIVRAKNYYLPVLNINHKTTPLYYYICYLFYLVFSFKNAYDLHKHVETHNDSDAYSCDVEGCGFTSRTLQTLKQHYKRAHVVSILNSRIEYIAVSDPKFQIYMCLVSYEWRKYFIFPSNQVSICAYF